MKKTLLLLVLVFMVLVSGCSSNKKVVPLEEFQAAAESLGFTVSVEGYKMTASKGSCSVMYYRAVSEEEAERMYKESIGEPVDDEESASLMGESADEENTFASQVGEFSESLAARGFRGGSRRSFSRSAGPRGKSKPKIEPERHHATTVNGQTTYVTRRGFMFFHFSGPSSCQRDIDALAKKIGY